MNMQNNTVSFPHLYRFVGEDKWVDEFFKTGSLRLSTFSKCKTLEDEDRRDETEGQNTVVGEGSPYTFETSIAVDNAIILCTSTIPQYKDQHKCIEIIDVAGFAFEITKALTNQKLQITDCIVGECLYNDNTIRGRANQEKMNELMRQINSGTGSFDFNLMFDLARETSGPDVYFTKPADKAREAEFRFVWTLSENPEKEFYDVVVPEARRYCREFVI